MTFGERMKELLDQGLTVSKELASKAGEKAQDWGGRGIAASKDLVNKAGAKAQDLGERGVLMLEIKQLENQAQRHIARLGAEVYNAFVERGSSTVSVDDPAVKALLAEIESLKGVIEKREKELQNRRSAAGTKE
jgi:capsule polysaccharide export protein KpsE/RkpR